jgi:hypothetical protein
MISRSTAILAVGLALAIIMIWLVAGYVLGSEPVTFESSDSQTTLIELFTSEGCSSCPPADAWISHLKDSPDLWKKIVPVAFHVDYWNNLGWRDRFARPEFTARQRRYVAAWHGDSVYTPGFVVNGQEWRGWFSDRTVARKQAANVGNLKLRHDFVVLQLAKTDLIASGDRWIGSISIPKQNAEKPRALAAWVSEEDVDSPIQATGGWLNSPAR